MSHCKGELSLLKGEKIYISILAFVARTTAAEMAKEENETIKSIGKGKETLFFFS